MPRRVISILVLLTFATCALCQDYPSRPIRLLTAGAGGGSDIITRVVAQDLAARLGVVPAAS